jgi:hypothetical protein
VFPNLRQTLLDKPAVALGGFCERDPSMDIIDLPMPLRAIHILLF